MNSNPTSYINIHGNNRSKLYLPYNHLIRILNPNNALRLAYRRRKDEHKTTVHWGQRKLILSEIEFLTKYYNNNTKIKLICIYIGAAPGTHLALICELFPLIQFICIDPSIFASNIIDENSNPICKNMVIISEYMSISLGLR